ncbi:MAG: EF-P beta-lysylation protein EpmB [Gammaproteobacteria bacterium]|nr:EF-P beta-lysylation protein EpmB [Gammaproteobacteria bacterium]
MNDTLELKQIPLSDADATWQSELKHAYRSASELRLALGLPPGDDRDYGFPILAPRPYVSRITKGDPTDPLLLQVLSNERESDEQLGFSTDPLDERDANPRPGVVHKYQSRQLFIATGQCAVNCRYCFRRHFPYSDNRVSRAQWRDNIRQTALNPSVNEIILSGGDPLLLNDDVLNELLNEVERHPSITRVRIHTRLPLVIPQRITDALIATLSNRRFKVIVVWHINHPNEIDEAVKFAALRLQQTGVTQLNQSVLLKSVNNAAVTLAELSERLFSIHILPYYLHLLDRVAGAAHFLVSDREAKLIYRELAEHLPGFLVPKLARETSGNYSKNTFGTDNL